MHTAEIASLQSIVSGLEGRFRKGTLTAGELQDLKSAVDDIRLRLWGLLTADTPEESQAFQERFRIRRAREQCAKLGQDLLSGAVSADHEELPHLAASAAELADSIEKAIRRAR